MKGLHSCAAALGVLVVPYEAEVVACDDLELFKFSLFFCLFVCPAYCCAYPYEVVKGEPVAEPLDYFEDSPLPFSSSLMDFLPIFHSVLRFLFNFNFTQNAVLMQNKYGSNCIKIFFHFFVKTNKFYGCFSLPSDVFVFDSQIFTIFINKFTQKSSEKQIFRKVFFRLFLSFFCACHQMACRCKYSQLPRLL